MNAIAVGSGTGSASFGASSRGYGFVAEHASRIDRLARAIARDDAGDVAQDVALSLLRVARRGNLDPARIEHVEAYLRVAVRNGARRARARRREELVLDGDLDALAERAASRDGALFQGQHGEATGLDRRRTATRLHARLRPRDAQAFALMVHHGLAIDEVARSLGTTANHVHQMRHRILGEARRLHAESSLSGSDASEERA